MEAFKRAGRLSAAGPVVLCPTALQTRPTCTASSSRHQPAVGCRPGSTSPNVVRLCVRVLQAPAPQVSDVPHACVPFLHREGFPHIATYVLNYNAI